VALGADNMAEEYPFVVKTLYEHGDFFELNFSCPNHK
jgi:dihydroorotate dehydrogenase